MELFLKNYKHFGYFVSGAIILFVGMVALNASVMLSGEQQKLEVLYQSFFDTHSEAIGDSAVVVEAQIEQASEYIHAREKWLYWSVIAIGFIGFILSILNADKLIRLQKINEEKKGTLTLLEGRLKAMEAAPDGIGMTNKHGHVTYLNPAFAKIYGLEPDAVSEMMGRPWEELIPDLKKTADSAQEDVVEVLQKNGQWAGQSQITREDQTIVQVDVALQRLDDGSIIATMRDITAKIKADEEKKEMQSQLNQAQKMEAIGRLAGGVAHDFNNILAAINGYAEFLEEDLKEGTPEHGFVVNILNAGQQARTLVDQILAFSRHKKGDFESVNLMVPVVETLGMLKASLPKTVDVETNFEIDQAPINGNETQIAQVIMNLCVNAKDAMPDEKGTLKIEVARVSTSDVKREERSLVANVAASAEELPVVKISDGAKAKETKLTLGTLIEGREYIRLVVEDNGSGMSRTVMENIFEPFFTTKPVDKGTGLGLATVHGVITGHKGALRIKSVLGQGTRFELFFPMTMGTISIGEQDSNSQDNKGVGKILLVEDQAQVRDMTAAMLDRLGYKVDTAENGVEAMKVIKGKPDHYDLVLTDHNMPKMTGLELVYQLHSDHPDLPCVLLSGYSQKKLQDMMDEHPMIKGVLRKPISKKALGEQLAYVLSAQSSKNAEVA